MFEQKHPMNRDEVIKPISKPPDFSDTLTIAKRTLLVKTRAKQRTVLH